MAFETSQSSLQQTNWFVKNIIEIYLMKSTNVTGNLSKKWNITKACLKHNSNIYMKYGLNWNETQMWNII